MSKPNNVVPFKTITGGKEPPEHESPHWLRNIPEHYVFIASPQGQVAAFTFQVVRHMDRSTYLMDMQSQTPLQVHTARFSHGYEKLQVLPVEYPKEEEDGSGDQLGQGLDQSPAPAEEQHGLVEDDGRPGAVP